MAHSLRHRIGIALLDLMNKWGCVTIKVRKGRLVVKALIETELNLIMDAFVAECAAEFGNKLSDVKLFGSYARGDYSDESDIDVMVILDMSDDEARKCLSRVCRIASDTDIKYNVTISPVLRSKRKYDLRKNTYGFCRNIERYGISKYAG